MFNWKGKRVVMSPIPPTPKSTKEKEYKFVSMCNQGEFLVGSVWTHVLHNCFYIPTYIM